MSLKWFFTTVGYFTKKLFLSLVEEIVTLRSICLKVWLQLVMSSLEYSVTIVYENTSFYYDLLEMFEFVEKQCQFCSIEPYIQNW